MDIADKDQEHLSEANMIGAKVVAICDLMLTIGALDQPLTKDAIAAVASKKIADLNAQLDAVRMR